MSDLTCAHCDSIIENERFVEIQPGGFMYDGTEMYRDNMAYTVHADCVAKFAERMEA